MSRTLLVVPTAADVGLVGTCLGVVRALDRRGVNVGFVKPVAQPRADGGADRSTELIAATTTLWPPQPLSTAQLEHQLGASRLEAALEDIVAICQPVRDRCDVIVVEGLSPGPTRLYASALNQAVAQALDADVLLVARWPGPAAALAETLTIAAGGYWSGEQPRVVGCVVNGLPAQDPRFAAELGGALRQDGLNLIATLPYRPELTWLRVRDLVRELAPKVLNDGDLTRRIRDVA